VHERVFGRNVEFAARARSNASRTLRRELAERYLKNRERSLAEASSLLGFAAPSGFARWYRRQFRGSASEARGRAPKRPR